MTTTQPAALPECIAHVKDWPDDRTPIGLVWDVDPASVPVGTKLYALAALQPQPAAEVSDEEISRLWSWSATAEAERTATTQQHAFAYALIALRPQAEPAQPRTFDDRNAKFREENWQIRFDAAVEARRAAQEQLYTERERHTAEVKRLQAEIGRLQSLRPQAVPMTDEQRQQAFNNSWATSADFFAGIVAAEAHYFGITAQGAQGGEG